MPTLPMPPDTKRRARAAALALLAIESLALSGLLRRISAPPVIFGFYSPQYFPIVLAFGGVWLATLYLAWRPAAFITAGVAGAARWLRKRWWLFALLAYAGLEGWYALIGLVKRVFFPAIARRPFMTSVLLALAWAVLVGLLAGRTQEDRKKTIANLGLAVASVVLTFWLASVALVRVLNFNGAGDSVHAWGDLLRYDYRLGYRLKPDLRDYQPAHCPQEAQGVTYFTDEQGFRNLPGAQEAPLVVVGDSFVFGQCANYEDMWTTRLGEALGTDVANYAVPGIGLWQYNAYTDTLVRDGSHKVLVYGVFVNDLTFEPDFDRSLHDRLAINGILYYMSPVNYTIAQYLTSSPARQIYTSLTAPRGAGDPGPPAAVTLDNGVVLDEIGGIYSQYLGPEGIVRFRLTQAMAYADEMDMDFVVVMIPSKRSAYREAYAQAFPQSADLTERENQAYDDICAWLIGQGTPCYNPTAEFHQAAQDGPALYFSTDGHLSTYGNQLMADLVADFLRRSLPDDSLSALHSKP